MKRKKEFLLMVIILFGFIALIAKSDEDENSMQKPNVWSRFKERYESRKSIPVVMNKKFKEECMSCHMAYLPGLLPERSWTKLMNGLDKHFGEDASLDEQSKKEVLEFLVANSSDHVKSRRGSKILATMAKDDAPISISETWYFKRKHHELSENVYKRKAIGSKGNCMACHQGAESGDFNEHAVRIPKESDIPVKRK